MRDKQKALKGVYMPIRDLGEMQLEVQ